MEKQVLLFKCLLLLGVFTSNAQQTNFSQFTGPYLGQKPPGNTPELFAPGIVSTGANDLSICFSADGNEFFYSVTNPSYESRFILSSSGSKSGWITPVELPFFSKDRSDSYPFLTHDGKRLFFNSRRSTTDTKNPVGRGDNEIWFAERINGKWSNPQIIDFGDQYIGPKGFPSVASNGNLYFHASFDGKNPAIYCSRFDSTHFEAPERLGEAVNGSENASNFHPYIAPDESFLLFDSRRNEENTGLNDIYICFRDKSGKWSKAKSLGAIVNTPYFELRPFLTYDGKYLFFTSDRANNSVSSDTQMTLSEAIYAINQPGNGLQDIYWIDAKFIMDLKSEGR